MNILSGAVLSKVDLIDKKQLNGKRAQTQCLEARIEMYSKKPYALNAIN